MRLITILACVSAAALGAAGCGQSSSTGSAAASHVQDEQIAKVVSRLTEASRSGDGAYICDRLFTANLRVSVQRASGRSCASEVQRNVAGREASYKLLNVKTTGNSATAVVADQAKRVSLLVLTRQTDDWRIARITPVAA
jgi:hypothetical protein